MPADSQGVAVREAEMSCRISGLLYQTPVGLSVPRCDKGLKISYCPTRLMALHGKGSDQICWGRRRLASESRGLHRDICGLGRGSGPRSLGRACLKHLSFLPKLSLG